jgi:hypothetical protein
MLPPNRVTTVANRKNKTGRHEMAIIFLTGRSAVTLHSKCILINPITNGTKNMNETLTNPPISRRASISHNSLSDNP